MAGTMTPQTENLKYKNNALVKAIRIIDYVMENDGAYFMDICADLGLAKSSAYQLLKTCEDFQLLEQRENKKYRLGIKLLEWGYAKSKGIEIRQVAHRPMKTLAEKLNVSVHMGVMTDAVTARYISKYDSPNYTIKSTVLGQEILYHCQCTGKVLLAWLPEQQQEAILQRIEFTPFTDSTILDPAVLRAELKKIREQGYALDNKERLPELYGIGVPVYNWKDKVVAAVSIGYLATELSDEKLMTLVGALKETSREITNQIGNLS